LKRQYGLCFYGAGFALLLIQFLVILFGYVNNEVQQSTEQFAIVENLTFWDIIQDIWSGVAGILLLIALFVHRVIKGPDVMMVLVGVMLWVIQILTLRTEEMRLSDLFSNYALAIIGIVLVVVSVLLDVYFLKFSEEDADKKNKK